MLSLPKELAVLKQTRLTLVVTEGEGHNPVRATGVLLCHLAHICRLKTVRSSEDPLAVVNPILLVEITSRSTEEYDRTTKLQNYQALPSVREVLIVSHREPLLTLYRREGDDGWTMAEARAGGAVTLACTGTNLAVDDVYRDGLEDGS